MTLYHPKTFMPSAQASWFRYPKLLAQAVGRNKWTFLDRIAHGFKEIALWGLTDLGSSSSVILSLAKRFHHLFTAERQKAS
jgi:hypothetical protein